MGFQKTVNNKFAEGMEGEFFDNSPRVVRAFAVFGSETAPAKIAAAFTYSDVEGKAVVGGDGVFAGIAVNPKEYAIYNNFTPSLVLPNGVAGQLCTFGHIFVRVTDAVSVGQAAFYNTTDGSIKGAAAGSTVEGYVEIKNSQFIEKAAQAGEIAKLQLR